MTGFEIGVMIAFPAAIVGVGIIFWPLVIPRFHGEHSRARKVVYRCGCTVRSLCDHHERSRVR